VLVAAVAARFIDISDQAATMGPYEVRIGIMTNSTRVALTYAMAGILVIGAAFVLVPPMFAPATATPCGERYANSTLFRLERDGAVVTLDEIRARVGESRALGLSENVEIVKPADPRIPAAMQVSLRGNSGASTSSAASGGVAFPWQPHSVRTGTASCLTYNVFFIGDFEFQNGGTLPGIEGSDRSQTSQDHFAGNLVWHEDGWIGVQLAVASGDQSESAGLEARNFTFPRGRWIRVDQEVVLNTPGASDGALRVWIDEALAIERTDIAFRNKVDVGFDGVAANVFYGAVGAVAWAPSETTIWISPLELSWR
jgi:hypothetical protein